VTDELLRNAPFRNDCLLGADASKSLPMLRSNPLLQSSEKARTHTLMMELACCSEISVYIYCILILPATLGPRIYSASNRNEYQKQKNNVSEEQSVAGA
jgi:hypothetical protein